MQVEFFGIPRERAGVASLLVRAETLGQLLTALRSELPAFSDLIESGQLHSCLVANLNGDRFVTDPRTPLLENDRVLILSADAGG